MIAGTVGDCDEVDGTMPSVKLQVSMSSMAVDPTTGYIYITYSNYDTKLTRIIESGSE